MKSANIPLKEIFNEKTEKNPGSLLKSPTNLKLS